MFSRGLLKQSGRIVSKRTFTSNSGGSSSSTLLRATGLLAALTGGSAVILTYGTNTDKRQRAFEKLDTFNATKATPATLVEKVEEVASLTREDAASPATVTEQEPEQEQESEQSAAYDPVTGEINWDCPCLGGMAHGPCGEEFKDAFSCFVHSEEDPKGVDCIEKFKAMQDCFRKHPEHYAKELADDDEDEVVEEETLSSSEKTEFTPAEPAGDATVETTPKTSSETSSQ